MCQATKGMRSVVDAVEGKYRSAVFAGIVPDKRHLDNGGFHVCLKHLKAYGNLGDYSSSRPLDTLAAVTAAGAGYSCACDIGLSPADMKRVYASVSRVHADKSDPRRKYINAINCWRGSGAAQRFNFQTGTVSKASPDHQSHVHTDQPRAYVDDVRNPAEAAKASRALASVLTGEPRAVWEAREEPKPAGAVKSATARAAEHPVRSGDTLTAIGKRYGLTVAQLKAWNRLSSDDIFVGQTLRLTASPTAAAARPKPVVAPWPVNLKAGDSFKPRVGAPKYVTVARWQEKVKALGYDLTVDGRLGPESGRVLVAFQRREGLKVTGVLDKPTFARSYSSRKRAR